MGSSCPCFSSLGLANGGKKAKKKKKSQAFGSKDRARSGSSGANTSIGTVVDNPSQSLLR